MSDELRRKLKETTDFLKAKGIENPEVGVILGSGLNDYADCMEDPLIIPYNDIPNMQAGKLSDHRGQLIYGEISGKKVILLAGRFHYYESGDMLREALRKRAHEEGIELREGVYMMFSVPTFETPAEIIFARTVGADAAGMSTVPEAIIANHAGREVIGISFLSNMAAGVLDQPLSGEEVNEAGMLVKDTFKKVVDMAIEI